MKKKLIFTALAAVAIVSGATVSSFQKKLPESNPMTLANVEALSRFEFQDPWKWMEPDAHYYVTHFDGWTHCEDGGNDNCPL